jgi:lysozyme family protein
MVQSNYPACVSFVRKQEGGNCDTPGDRGGRTGRGGITHTTYDAYRCSKVLQVQDVWLISDAEIAEIYAANYWNPIHGDLLPAGQDLALFDYAINSGPAKANEARLLAGAGATPALIHKICASRLSFMQSLGSWGQFSGVWGRRVALCEATALRMAGGLSVATVDKATQAKDAHQKKAARVVVAGVAGAGALHYFAIGGKMLLFAVLAAAAVGVAVSIFNAWRQGQRSDALATAVKQMQAAQAAAAGARAAAAAQIAAKEAVFATERASIDAAKAAIEKAIAPVAAQPSQTKP